MGWLLCVQNHEVDNEDLEPPVPPGLGQLSASLDALADFLRLDGDLLDVAAEARKRAEEAERRRREAEIARAEYLDKIASQQSKLWARVEGLIATKQPKRYDEAVRLLLDLRDLAQREGKDDKFRMRTETIHAVHARKPSLLERLRKAGL